MAPLLHPTTAKWVHPDNNVRNQTYDGSKHLLLNRRQSGFHGSPDFIDYPSGVGNYEHHRPDRRHSRGRKRYASGPAAPPTIMRSNSHPSTRSPLCSGYRGKSSGVGLRVPSARIGNYTIYDRKLPPRTGPQMPRPRNTNNHMGPPGPMSAKFPPSLPSLERTGDHCQTSIQHHGCDSKALTSADSESSLGRDHIDISRSVVPPEKSWVQLDQPKTMDPRRQKQQKRVRLPLDHYAHLPPLPSNVPGFSTTLSINKADEMDSSSIGSQSYENNCGIVSTITLPIQAVTPTASTKEEGRITKCLDSQSTDFARKSVINTNQGEETHYSTHTSSTAEPEEVPYNTLVQSKPPTRSAVDMQIHGMGPELPIPSSTAMDVDYMKEAGWNTGLDVNMQEPDIIPLAELQGSAEEDSSISASYGPHLKPALKRQPPIWCQSRQEICETFDWFKSYQGGVYFSHNAVKGYLLSAFSASRDQFLHGGRLIISHGGGKAESPHSYRGQWVISQADDQSAHDKSVRALLTNFRESRPLALVIDDKYLLFPYDLGATDVTYAVLGLYTITDAWAEYQSAGNDRGRVIRYKFAFRWCEGQGDPWWLNQSNEREDTPTWQTSDDQVKLTDPLLQPSSFASRRPVKKVCRTPLIQNSQQVHPEFADLYKICDFCKTKSPHVYSIGWACLNSLCIRFWELSDGANLHAELEYNEAFLRLPEAYVLPENLRDIAPPRPTLSPDQVNTTYSFTRGSHCRKCGRLSCRVKLECWECVNCKDKFGSAGKIRSGMDFLTQELPVPFLDHYINPDAGIMELPPQEFTSQNGSGRVQVFKLPHTRGCIQHIQAEYVPGRYNAADTIFAAYQEQAYEGTLPFRRWPMRAHKCRGDLLTNYFSQNSGEPYNYVGGTANTLSFEKTGTAVVQARDYIQSQILSSIGLETKFNEILSCAYMERQKMAFHSDSERGLGPVVAGLSLGAPALIHFRSHHKQKRGESAGGAPHQSQIVMSFVLRHGDVLVMNGGPVQDFYEHTVVPTNFRIAATARWIDPAAAVPEVSACRTTATLLPLPSTNTPDTKQE